MTKPFDIFGGSTWAVPVRTSVDDPIRVDWISRRILPLPGRLGLTLAPGRKDLSRSCQWKRDLDADLQRLVKHHRANLLVTLLQDYELPLLQIEGLADRCRAHGLKRLVHPIHDGGIPESVTAFRHFVGQIQRAVTNGRAVVVHCRAGLGRSGLVAACLLVRAGLSPEGAIRAVRAARPGAVETTGQEAFILGFK